MAVLCEAPRGQTDLEKFARGFEQYLREGVAPSQALARVFAGITLSSLGFEHRLYNYGAVTETPFSDINNLGKFWIGPWWLRLYWTAFAVVLLVLAYGLWRRGTESRLWPRLIVFAAAASALAIIDERNAASAQRRGEAAHGCF